ncbi:hypothetical protein Tco_1416749, partial [Tanacetum coccineum]
FKFVMSDSEDSTVTYTEVSSPFEDLSNIGSLRVDGLPMMLEDPYVEAALQAPPSPDYVPGPEYLPSPVYVPYVPKPVYLEFMPPKDDVLPAKEQPLPPAVSPTADSPGYTTEFDPEEDPKEDDEDPNEDPADYPDDRDDDDEEEESSRDDADDEEEDNDEDKEEDEEHLALADFVPPPTYRNTARISIMEQTLIPFPYAAEVPSPPLPVSSPLPVSPPPQPVSPTCPLGYRAAMIRLRAESPSTSHPLPLPLPMSAAAPSTYILTSQSETPPSGTPPLLPIPLPTSSLPLLLPSTDCRAGVFEVTLPPQKRLCIALGPRFEVSKSSSTPIAGPTRGFRADYGFVGTLDDEIRRDLEREDTNEIYRRLDDAPDDRSLMSGQLNMLRRDRHAHARTTKLIESEARLSREAWTHMVVLQSQQTPAKEPVLPEIPEEAGSIIFSCDLKKMAPKQTTRSTTATTTTPTTSVTDEQLKRLIDQGVTDALAARDADRSPNGEDSHDSGTGVRRQAPLARECTYPDFMKCKPLYFKGTKEVVKLTQWFERMETTVGHDVAYAMTWTNLKKKMTNKYCPKGEELALMCARMFPEESKKIEKYVGGLPAMIHRSVMASKPKTMQDAIEFATELMDKKIRTFAKRQSKNKRKLDDNQQQQQNKRQTLAGHMLQGL